MRATVSAKALGNATRLVQGIAQTKISNPIVENTVIRIEEDHIDVLATNLSVSIRVRLAAESTEKGEAALPAKLLSQVVGVLPDAPVTFSKKGNEVILESGRNRFKICSLSTEDFPPFVPEVEGPVLEISTAVAKQAMERTVFACSEERARYQLGGVKFIHEGGKVLWVATDGRRLSKVTHEIEDLSAPKAEMLIPQKTIQEVIHALPEEGVLRITVGQKRVLFEAGDNTIASTLLEDNFPPYEPLIPSAYAINISADRDELMAAVRQAAVLANERSRLVSLSAQDNTIVITGQRMEAGDVRSVIDAMTDGNSATASYNVVFLMECLRVLGSGKAIWRLVQDGGPAYLSKEEDESFLHIIMPMTVREEEERPPEEPDEEDFDEGEDEEEDL
jgi:DNA polymerase III subunit beta